MKLNPDCIRDVLLAVEEHADHRTFMDFPSESPDKYKILSNYQENVVLYHIKQCELSGLVAQVKWFLSGNCLVGHLSPKGHEFLENIRSDTNWEKTKTIAREAGSLSLQALAQIATSVISDMLSKRF